MKLWQLTVTKVAIFFFETELIALGCSGFVWVGVIVKAVLNSEFIQAICFVIGAEAHKITIIIYLE